MISFILIQNRQGKTRLAKWYSAYNDEEKLKLKGEVHRLVAPRDQKHQSNFVEFRGSQKIVYRRYAGLFFCGCVDANDNELAYLEAIHFFVEVLDQFFGNVCELDLVFNFYKVYAILDEVFLAGEIQETSKQVVLTRLEHLDKLENKEGRSVKPEDTHKLDGAADDSQSLDGDQLHLITDRPMADIADEAKKIRTYGTDAKLLSKVLAGEPSDEAKLWNERRSKAPQPQEDEGAKFRKQCGGKSLDK